MEPETTTQRADRAVTEEGRAAAGRIAEARAERDAQSSFTAPSVTSIEAPQQPVVTPENTSFGVDMPTLSFLQPSAQEQASKQNVANIRNANAKVGQDLYSQMLGLGTQEGTQAQFEQELGVGTVSTRKSELESEILATQQKHLLKKEEILKGSGLSQGQKGAVLSEIERKQAIEATDLEIRYQAVTSSLNNLSSIAKRKADIVFGDKKAKVDALQFIYDENKEVLTDEENKLFQRSLMREKTALDMQVSKYAQFEEEKLKYVNNAAQAGADNNTLKAIQAAQSLDDLYGMENISQYAMSPADKLDMKIRQRNYDKLGLEIQSIQDQAAAAEEAAKSGILSPEKLKVANDLRSEVNNLQEVKDAKNLEGDTAALIAALNQENGVGDIAAINSFQRLVVDPGVAVREGDVALLQSAQSFTDQSKLAAKGLFVGDKLTPEARKQMLDLVSGVYNFRVDLVDSNTEQIRTVAQEQGIDYGKYVGRNFKTYEELQAAIDPQEPVVFGVQATDDYVNNVFQSLSTTPEGNPFGVTLE